MPDASFPPTVSGIVPSACLKADLGPPRNECGIGGLVAWADRLWAITYVSHRKQSGTGTGLYEFDENLRVTKRPESYPGTYANRLVHKWSNLLFIGPWVIDAKRNVRTIKELLDVRIAGTALHPTDPDKKVLTLGMEGELFETELETLKTTQIADLVKLLETPGEGRVHFKDIYTAFGRVVVADNTYDEPDFLGTAADGRLAEWNAGAGDPVTKWTILERKPYVCVHGLGAFAKSETMYATGWDRASAILSVFTNRDQTWRRYRLPKASHNFDHMWQTEWPRIRSVEHERLLMDHHGMFYELSPHAYGNRLWGVRPICTHLVAIPDFCSYRGMLVLGTDNASVDGGQNVTCGEPQSGLWVGKTDDLWNFGKPKGWGGPWWEDAVKAGEASDPYLMTGFEHKCLHVSSDRAVKVRVEVDFMGHGKFLPYETLAVGAGGYVQHTFPTGFSAHWVRLVAEGDCVVTAQLFYT